MALIAAGIGAAAGTGKGIGQARAAKKMMLSPSEQKERDELERRKARGELGLTERERGSMEQRFLAEQAGAQRELEAASLQQAAARGLSGSVSGREVFLQEQAEAKAERSMRQLQTEMVESADVAEKAAERASLDALTKKQQAAEAARAEGIAAAFTGGLSSLGSSATEQANYMRSVEMAEADAAAKAQASEDMFKRMQAMYAANPSFNFGQVPGTTPVVQ
jgi:hypothetical protein